LTTARFRMSMIAHRRELEATLQAVQAGQDARSPSILAESLATDARRLLSTLQALEHRLEAIEARGIVDEKTLSVYLDRVALFERALARTRSVTAAVIGRFPAHDDDTDIDTLLTLPPGCNVIVVGGGDRPALGPGQEGGEDADES